MMLADTEDSIIDSDFYVNLWLYFICPSRREKTPAEEAAKYELKLDRCRRLRDKMYKSLAEKRRVDEANKVVDEKEGEALYENARKSFSEREGERKSEGKVSYERYG